MAGLRIKGPRPGYRRAGRVFGPDWTEVGPDEVSDAQILQLLEDPALVLQADAKGEWSTVSAEDRAQAIAMYRREPVIVSGDGSGTALAEIDPDQLRLAALGGELEELIDQNLPLLQDLGISSPLEAPGTLFLTLADRLATAEGNVERLTAELEALKTTTAAEPSGDGGPAQVGAGGAENGGEGGQPDGDRQPPSDQNPADQTPAEAAPKPVKPTAKAAPKPTRKGGA